MIPKTTDITLGEEEKERESYETLKIYKNDMREKLKEMYGWRESYCVLFNDSKETLTMIA